MQVKNIAAVLAFATLSAGAMADTITAEGFVQSAPATVATSTVSRDTVRSQAVQAVRSDVRDPIAAEGLRAQAVSLQGQRDRADVRAEASQANLQRAAASAQYNEGLVL
jgi:hypothetical protein